MKCLPIAPYNGGACTFVFKKTWVEKNRIWGSSFSIKQLDLLAKEDDLVSFFSLVIPNCLQFLFPFRFVVSFSIRLYDLYQLERR